MASFFDQAPLYNDRPNSSIRDLILMGGEQKARAAQQAGEIWGNAIQNLGGIAAGAVQQYGERKQEQKKQEQIKIRDAGVVSFVQQWDGKDPKELYTGIAKIAGPDYANKHAPGILAFRSPESKDPKTELGNMHASLKTFLEQPPEVQKLWWPGLKGRFASASNQIGLDPSQLPDEYNPEAAPRIKVVMDVLGEQLGKGGKAEGAKPVEVNAGATLVDPTTGKVIYKGEAKPEKAPALQHVDFGDSVGIIDPTTGDVVKRIPKGLAPQRPDKPEKAPTLKPLTQGEVKNVTELETSLADAAKLKADLSKPGATGAGSELGAALPNWLTQATGWGADSKKQQAVINRVKQMIGKALEGGVLRKEDEIKYQQILPTIGDAPDVAQAKIDGLISMLEEKRSITLDNLESTGRDVTKLKGKQASPAPGAGPQIGERRIIKGQQAEWDGNGWKAVK